MICCRRGDKIKRTRIIQNTVVFNDASVQRYLIYANDLSTSLDNIFCFLYDTIVFFLGNQNSTEVR